MPHSAQGHRRRRWQPFLGQSAGILLIGIAAGLLTNALRTEPLSLHTHWSSGAAAIPTLAENLVVPLDEARELFLNQSALFLDARPSESYRQGHIKGAVSLPLSDLGERYVAVLAELPQDEPIITYCSGQDCSLGEELARFLLGDGFNNVRVFRAGWLAWQRHDLPVGTGATP